MELLLAAFLGAVQGISEFLPISSTGHLIVLENWFGLTARRYGLTFDVALHMGTLIALVWYFRDDLLGLLDKSQRYLFILLAIGTAPAAVFGMVFARYVESSLRSNAVVAWALILIALAMVVAEWGNRRHKELTLGTAILVGFAQALALVPGVSRSGSTISAGMLLGLSRESAAKFSFLLAIPVMVGAGTTQLLGRVNSFDMTLLLPTLVGLVSAALVGYAAISWLLRFLRTRSLYPFVVYRIALGVILLILNA